MESRPSRRAAILAGAACIAIAAAAAAWWLHVPSRYFPAEEETYFATAWIWAGLSFPWNAGIKPPPTIT